MKILIVDDSQFSQLIVQKLIKQLYEDVEFIFASNGQDGFEKYKGHNPDYSFIDLLMPVINGQQLVKLIKEYDKSAKLFILSADVQKNVRHEMDAYGIMGFINKPFDEQKAKWVFNTIEGEKDAR